MTVEHSYPFRINLLYRYGTDYKHNKRKHQISVSISYIGMELFGLDSQFEFEFVSISYIGMEQQHLVVIIIITYKYGNVNRTLTKKTPKIMSV